MPTSEENHKFDREVLGRHNGVPNDTEGGSCLNRHYSVRGQYFEHSCCHAWQGRERARSEDAKHYDGKTPRGLESWDVDHGANFFESTIPYDHEAHHIIPSGLLSRTIVDAGNGRSGSGQLMIDVRIGLLDAEYNINHMINVIILPERKEVGRQLELPTHTRPSKGDPNTRVPCHDEYDALVQQGLRPIINKYMRLLSGAAQTKAKHPASPDALARAQLERLSDEMRQKIFRWGVRKPGAPLDAKGR